MIRLIRETLESETFKDIAILVARILLGFPFLIFGVGKILNHQKMQAYVETAGVPGFFLYIVIPYQILCGLAVWVGFQTRWAAFLLGGFCIVAASLYHSNLTRMDELAFFTKDFATAGGFLLLWKYGPGRFSLDALRKRPA